MLGHNIKWTASDLGIENSHTQDLYIAALCGPDQLASADNHNKQGTHPLPAVGSSLPGLRPSSLFAVYNVVMSH